MGGNHPGQCSPDSLGCFPGVMLVLGGAYEVDSLLPQEIEWPEHTGNVRRAAPP